MTAAGFGVLVFSVVVIAGWPQTVFGAADDRVSPGKPGGPAVESVATVPAGESAVKLVSSSAAGVVLRYEAQEPSIGTIDVAGREYTTVGVDGCEPMGMMAAPDLPVTRVRIAVPDCEGIDVGISTHTGRTVGGVRVVPSPSYISGEGEPGELSRHIYREGSVYASDALWPEDAARVFGPTWMATQRIVEVEFHPARVNPVLETLLYHDLIEVTLSFRGVRAAAEPFRDSPLREKLFRSMLLNYESGRGWRTKRPRAGRDPRGDYFTTSENWAKLIPGERGIYKISHGDLLSAGIDPDMIDPRSMRVFSGGSLSVPPAVIKRRPEWMQECAILVEGEEDGLFDSGDFMAFYALDVDGWVDFYGIEEYEEPYHENRYANENVYWLTWEEPGATSGFEEPPRRMEEVGLTGSRDPLAASDYVQRDHFERNIHPKEGASDGWFWVKMIQSGLEETVSLNKTLDHVVTDSTGLLRARLQGMDNNSSVNPDHHAKCYLNGALAYDGYWDGYRYVIFETDHLPFNDGLNTFEVTAPRDTGSEQDYIYIDWFDLEYWRRLFATDERLAFGSSGRTGVIEYSIDGFETAAVDVYKIVDKYTALIVPGVAVAGESGGRAVVFQDDVADTASYIAVSDGGYLVPTIEPDGPANLRSPPDADYVMIVYDGFYDQAVRLKTYRESQAGGGFSVWLVRISDVYDEFSWGLADPTAIRDFLKHTFENTSVGPTHAVLIGDATSDYRNYSTSGIPNYVPTHYTVKLIYDEPESWPAEQWFVGFDDTTYYVPAMALARLSARSSSELSTMIDKIERYETESGPALWKNNVILVGDDEYTWTCCEYYHTLQTEQLGRQILPWPFERTKIYLMEYERAGGGKKPAARAALLEAWNAGGLIVNYTGHGSEIVLAHEDAFLYDDISLLLNIDKLPLFIAASCRLNKFDMESVDSLGESLVKSSIGGAIASLGSTRDSGAGSNAVLNRNFLEFMFAGQQVAPTAVLDIGMSFQAAFSLGSWTNNTKFMIVGDPAVTLVAPAGAGEVVLEGLESMSRQQTVPVSGENAGATEGLDGVVLVRVTDSADTSGYTSDPPPPHAPTHVNYRLPGDIVFDGPMAVDNGAFSGEFVVSHMAEEGPYARIRAYFYADEIDGSFSLEDISIADSVAVADTTKPIIALEFEGGATSVTPGALLTIAVFDSSGINTIDRVLGEGITLVVDGGADTTNLTDSFVYDLGDHTRGSAAYTIPSLSLGGHTVSVAASDNIGNRSEESLWFEVVSATEFAIRNVANFPNPFPDSERTNSDGTYLLFWLSEESSVRIDVFTVGGRIIRVMDDITGEAGANEVYWDGRDQQGDDLANGVYLYRISATALEYRGRKAEAIGKAVVMRRR